jgi:DNA mismatch repair protein MutS2
MAQAGLHIPVAADSELCVFTHIYADIGDQQSIEQSLSTFSSHISHIVDILAEADDRSLVLLDEVGAGTDPAEGASLGIAILEHLDQVGATCIATTHHDALKSYAYTHPRTLNARVEFDVNTLSPTYRLLVGLPGKSNAYIIAERLGLPSELIQRARDLMGQELHQVADLIQKLTTESQEMEKHKADVEARLRGVNRLEKETDKMLALAEEERREILDKALKEAQDIVDKALQQSQAILAKLPAISREEGKELIKTLHQEARTVRQRAKKLGKVPEPLPTAHLDELQEGQRVQIRGVGQKGILQTLTKDGKQATVQVGALKLEVPAHQLIPIAAPKKSEKAPTISVSEVSTGQDEAQMLVSELVLIGKRVDDAIEAMDKYLDQAFLSGYPSVTIVHGIGTGKLKGAVSKYLRTHPHVASYAVDERNHGATIARLQRK